jgi:hypothetical protein
MAEEHFVTEVLYVIILIQRIVTHLKRKMSILIIMITFWRHKMSFLKYNESVFPNLNLERMLSVKSAHQYA